MKKKIFVIEDETDIRELLESYLKKEGYEVEGSGDGEAGLRRIRKEPCDLLLLDLMLPGIDGLEICRTLRSSPQTAAIPVIMITAKGDVTDRIVGLEMGADDYIAKPFSPREVVARVKALFRRLEQKKAKVPTYAYGGILLDPDRFEVSYKGEVQTLTPKEFKLLEYFFNNRGRVLSRDTLLNEVWGYDYFGTTRTADVHIARLRQRFPILNKAIVSIKGLGYKLEEDAPE